MTRTASLLRTGFSTALAAGLLAGCTMGGDGGQPSRLASSASTALEKGNPDKAVTLAEQAVLSDPRNSGYRLLLGNAYLRAGRFASAQQAYSEAIDLGESSGKAALSLALSEAATGRGSQALATLRSYRHVIPASDYGLALALAGDPNGGIAVLVEALRSGESTPKVRQNLAYSYALAGQWREARVMASQDVPAAELDARMSDWAMTAKPEDAQKRVAALLGVPVVADDAGQPAALALANYPSTEQLAQEAQGQAPLFADAAASELPPVETGGAPAPLIESAAPVQLAAYEPGPSSVAQPAPPSRRASAYRVVGANLPAEPSAAPSPAPSTPPMIAAPAAKPKAAARPTAAAPAGNGTHVVQLGSFSSPEGARRAWAHYTARMPELKGYRNVTTQVTVNGRQFWRVQAVGLNGYAAASSLCSSVRSRFGACLVLSSPTTVTPAGRVVDTRMARRRR